MENAPYPSLPYSIRVQTRTAIVWMIWQDTAWDTPAPVTYNTDYEPAIADVKDYFTTATGFQGYPIEDVDRPAPMDIHAALVGAPDRLILGFDLIGLIPDPPSSPDEDIEQDEEDESDHIVDVNEMVSASEESVLESIPPGAKVKLPFILEDTGETVLIETDAQEAIAETEEESALFESIIKRMES